MQLDLRTLQMFHRMAREGVNSASSRLNNISTLNSEVAVTRIQFVAHDALNDEFQDEEHLGVGVDLGGGISGQSIIVFDENAAHSLTDYIVTELEGHLDDETDDQTFGIQNTALSELGHMMNCGFIDGWANVLNTAIDVSPPSVGSGKSSEEIFGDINTFSNDNIAIVFQSQIDLEGTEIAFRHYLFPDLDDLDKLLSDDRDDTGRFDFEKLHGFDQMVRDGTEEASNTINMMTGVETEMTLRHLNFVPVHRIPQGLTEGDVVGVAFAFDGLPSGYLVFVFDEYSAAEIVTEMQGEMEEPFGDLGKSALQELGNIMASGMLDGWANLFDTGLNHSPPKFVRDGESDIMDSIVAQIGENQDYAFLFDTEISAAGAGSFDCRVYSLFKEGDLELALSELNLDGVESVNHSPEFPLSEGGE